MRMRQVIGVAAVAVLALVAGACGGDDDEKADDSTTSTTEAAEESTTTTLDDEDYTAAIDEYIAQVEAAGTELCTISTALTDTPPAPANTAQSKQFVELYAQLLRTLAGAAGDDATTAQTLTTTADQLLAEAEAAGYPTDFLTSADTAPASLTTEEFQAANTALTSRAQSECAPATTAAGDTTTTTAG